MSWYDFGHRKDNFISMLPANKKPIDTSFYYQELIAFGGWYFAPVPGSRQRRFYNRVYFNPSGKEIKDFNLDDRAVMFINLGKTKFGKLEIKIKDDWLDDETIARIRKDWTAYYDYIADKVVKSYIVVYPEGRNDKAIMFNTKAGALNFAILCNTTLSANMRNKYGVQIYKPHTETILYDSREAGE